MKSPLAAVTIGTGMTPAGASWFRLAIPRWTKAPRCVAGGKRAARRRRALPVLSGDAGYRPSVWIASIDIGADSSSGLRHAPTLTRPRWGRELPVPDDSRWRKLVPACDTPLDEGTGMLQVVSEQRAGGARSQCSQAMPDVDRPYG